MHNLTWYHGMLCREVIGFTLKKLTQKFYGSYYHNVTTHAAIQNLLVFVKSTHTEDQERMFNTITSIMKATSSQQSNHMISNITVIRVYVVRILWARIV